MGSNDGAARSSRCTAPVVVHVALVLGLATAVVLLVSRNRALVVELEGFRAADQMNERIYEHSAAKALEAAALPNDGTRNVWDLHEASWNCARCARARACVCVCVWASRGSPSLRRARARALSLSIVVPGVRRDSETAAPRDIRVPHRSARRIGKVGDGGKWVCDPHLLGGGAPDGGGARPRPACVVYSFGSAAEFSFETELHALTGCLVWVFDPFVTPEGLRLATTLRAVPPGAARGAPLPPGVTFVGRWGLGATRGDPTFPTLREIMRELGHARLDVLKLDIEGDEWDALLGDVLCPARGAAGLGHAPFGQLLVELHLRDGTTDIDRIAPLFARLEAHGFRTFHREPNVLDVQRYWEYSFVKAAPADPAAAAKWPCPG